MVFCKTITAVPKLKICDWENFDTYSVSSKFLKMKRLCLSFCCYLKDLAVRNQSNKKLNESSSNQIRGPYSHSKDFSVRLSGEEHFRILEEMSSAVTSEKVSESLLQNGKGGGDGKPKKIPTVFLWKVLTEDFRDYQRGWSFRPTTHAHDLHRRNLEIWECPVELNRGYNQGSIKPKWGPGPDAHLEVP